MRTKHENESLSEKKSGRKDKPVKGCRESLLRMRSMKPAADLDDPDRYRDGCEAPLVIL